METDAPLFGCLVAFIRCGGCNAERGGGQRTPRIKGI